MVAYITDLFFQAKVSQAASGAGVRLRIVSSLYKFFPELEQNPSLVIVDLNAEGISPTTLIVQVKQRKPQLPLLAYASHTQTELFERARKAGADRVLPRSQFSRQLAEILTELA